MASCKNTVGMTSTFSSKNTVPGGILITDSNEIFWSSQTRWEISHKISLTQWREQKAACLLRERSLKPKIVWSVLKNPCTKRYTSSIWGKWELHISICIWETGQSSICYTSLPYWINKKNSNDISSRLCSYTNLVFPRGLLYIYLLYLFLQKGISMGKQAVAKFLAHCDDPKTKTNPLSSFLRMVQICHHK